MLGDAYLDILRNDLSSFTQEVFYTVDPAANYLHNWHVDYIAEHLEACEKRQIRRLIINMPPRYLKSIEVSVAFPCWLMGRNPSEKIVVGSYAKDLSLKHSVDSRTVMQSDWYKECFPSVQIAADQNEKGKFQTTARGHRMAVSVGSAVTGEGGNFLIVDDPHNPLEALSDVQRQVALTWFEQTFSTRLNDKKNGVIIVVMQRLHQDDLTGYLLEKHKGDGMWTHLSLPAIEEIGKVYSFGRVRKERIQGDFLHPEREGEKEMAERKVELGAYGFAGQYQQRPAPLGGGEFKKEDIQYYYETPSPSPMNIYILVDPAHSKKKTSDWTAMVVIGLAPDNNYYLLDIIRDKFNPTERINALINLHKKWNKLAGKPPIVGYERYGRDSDSHYIKQAQEKLNYRFHIVDLGGSMNKLDRIRRLIPIFEQHRVYFPLTLPYHNYAGDRRDLIADFINHEMMLFPVATHDDVMDAMARICDEELFASFPELQTKTVVSDIYGGRRQHVDNSEAWMGW